MNAPPAVAIAFTIILFGGLFYLLVLRPAPDDRPETIEHANERLMKLRQEYQEYRRGKED